MIIILRDNDPINVGKVLNKIQYSNDDRDDIKFLVSLKGFKPELIVPFKKLHDNVKKLKDTDIVEFGKRIGKKLDKFVKFKLSVKGNEAPKDLKGPEIGAWIKNREKELFMNEDSNPNAHPQGKNKLTNRTTVMDMLDVISHKEFRGKDYDKLSDSEKKKSIAFSNNKNLLKKVKGC